MYSSKCELCIWAALCESHPLTAAELSLIQFCLLSCLPPPGSTLALQPSPLPATIQPPFWPLASPSLSINPYRDFFLGLSPCPSHCFSLSLSLCTPVLSFFHVQLFIPAPALPPPAQPASVLVGVRDVMQNGSAPSIILKAWGIIRADDSLPNSTWWWW